MFFAVSVWFTVFVLSLAFPPLLIITAVPLFLTARSVVVEMRRQRRLRRVLTYHAQQEAYYAEGRKIRGYLG